MLGPGIIQKTSELIIQLIYLVRRLAFKVVLRLIFLRGLIF
jgi:hypothetical protein